MPNRVEFVLEFADQSGLHPTTVYSWSKYENSDAHEVHSPYNWLNWKLDVDIENIPYISCWGADDGGCFPGYAGMYNGVLAGLTRLNRPRYQGIRDTVGKDVQTQLDAIKASDWGTHNLSKVKIPIDDLYWPWVAWYLGEGYWKKYGPRNKEHRPDVFPTFLTNPVIMAQWYAKLAAYLAKRQLS